MDTRKTILILVVAIPLITLGIICLMSVIAYLHIIGELIVAVMILSSAMGIYWLAAEVHHRVSMRAIERRDRVIAVEGVVALIRDGEVTHLSAMHEEARRPLMLPAPVKVTEEKGGGEHDYTDQILELHSHGVTIRHIAESLGVTKYQVEKTINAHRDKQTQP